jgi:hypothetical protein
MDEVMVRATWVRTMTVNPPELIALKVTIQRRERFQ